MSETPERRRTRMVKRGIAKVLWAIRSPIRYYSYDGLWYVMWWWSKPHRCLWPPQYVVDAFYSRPWENDYGDVARALGLPSDADVEDVIAAIIALRASTEPTP